MDLTSILPLITVWLQVRIPPDLPLGSLGWRAKPDFSPNSIGAILLFPPPFQFLCNGSSLLSSALPPAAGTAYFSRKSPGLHCKTASARRLEPC